MPWLLVAAAAIAAAWIVNAGRLMRIYFMTDAELRTVHERAKEYVQDAVSLREDRRVVTAMIAIESAGDPNARSAAGAVGLMQIRQPALDDYNAARGTSHDLVELVNKPALNVEVGYYYLRDLEVEHGLDQYDALRAYNVGIGTLRSDPKGVLGAAYAMKVLAYAQRLEAMGA